MSNVMGLLESVEPRFLTDYVKKMHFPDFELIAKC